MDSEGDTIPEGSFRDGDQEVYISLYHVQQDTLGVLTPTLVLTENMTMIDVLDNLIGSASDLPDPTKTIAKNIDQINSDLSNIKIDSVETSYNGDTIYSTETMILNRTITVTKPSKILVTAFAPLKTINNSARLIINLDNVGQVGGGTNVTNQFIMTQITHVLSVNAGTHTISVSVQPTGTSLTVKGYTTFGMNMVIIPS
jgi:hypothetical protein